MSLSSDENQQFPALEKLRAARMRKPQVLADLAARCGVSENAIALVFRTLAELAVRETNSHGAFNVPGIGTVASYVRQERMGRNPRTGETVAIPAKTIVKFHLDAELKRLCGDHSENHPDSAD